MAFVTTTTFTFGVLLSAVSGLLCYLGGGGLEGHLNWLPHSDLLLSHPQAALGTGAILIVVSLLCQPSQVR